jgi:hypothetical protein
MVAGRRSSRMKVDSLVELESAFAQWRKKKKHAREPIPEELRSRAQRATKHHGVRAVVGVTRVERARLFRTTSAHMKEQRATSPRPSEVSGSVPTFSRLELSARSTPSPRPIAEVETGSGVTLRVFEQTPEIMGLLSAVCGAGGVR